MFSFLKDGVDVVVGDLAVLGRKHVVGTVPNHGQHLIFTEFGVLINQATCTTDSTLVAWLHRRNNLSKRVKLNNVSVYPSICLSHPGTE